MRLVVARCSARYSGRLNAHLPLAIRLVLVKADGTQEHLHKYPQAYTEL